MSDIFFIDCEFNGNNGELLSMALVPQSSDFMAEEFYMVIDHDDIKLDPWVTENVIPRLLKSPVSFLEFQAHLEAFISRHPLLTIVADWPDDISYFCKALITVPGKALNFNNIRFVIDRALTNEGSALLHNALEDARAIRRSCRKTIEG